MSELVVQRGEVIVICNCNYYFPRKILHELYQIAKRLRQREQGSQILQLKEMLDNIY